MKIYLSQGVSQMDIFKISDIVEIQGQSECVTEKFFLTEKNDLKYK